MGWCSSNSPRCSGRPSRKQRYEAYTEHVPLLPWVCASMHAFSDALLSHIGASGPCNRRKSAPITSPCYVCAAAWHSSCLKPGPTDFQCAVEDCYIIRASDSSGRKYPFPGKPGHRWHKISWRTKIGHVIARSGIVLRRHIRFVYPIDDLHQH